MAKIDFPNAAAGVHSIFQFGLAVPDLAEQQRFLSTVESLAGLEGGALDALNVLVDPRVLDKAPVVPSGIFR